MSAPVLTIREVTGYSYSEKLHSLNKTHACDAFINVKHRHVVLTFNDSQNIIVTKRGTVTINTDSTSLSVNEKNANFQGK